MKRALLYLAAPIAAGAVLVGSYEASRTPDLQPATAQRVVRFSGFKTYGSGDHEFVRIARPKRAGWVFVLRSPSLNVVRRVDTYSDPGDAGFIYVPIFRDNTPQTAEIQLCGEGEAIASCPVLMPGTRLDLLPTFDYVEMKRRAVRS